MQEVIDDLIRAFSLPGEFLAYLLEPQGFFYLLSGLFLLALLVVIFSDRAQRRQLKARDAQIARCREEIARLEKQLEEARK